MPDQLFTDLYRDTENLTWAPTEQVRRRGRQRTRRTRIAASLAGVVAVAVVATGAVALAGGPDAAPPIPPATASPTSTPPTAPSGSASPTPTTGSTPTDGSPSSPSNTSSRPTNGSTDRRIPAPAMLQLSDLPEGFRFTGSNLDGDWTLESVTIYCGNQSPPITPGEVARRGAVFDSPTASITERVTRHSGGNAATSMDRVRELVTGCRPGRAGDSLSIMAEGLAGDESLMVGAVIDGNQSRWLFVRQGDLVAQVWLDEEPTPAEAKPYARKVADRLCAGTDAC